jgi:hypothetical protein
MSWRHKSSSAYKLNCVLVYHIYNPGQEGVPLPSQLLEKTYHGYSVPLLTYSATVAILAYVPTLPPEARNVTFKSVLTPVENIPLEATAREPPRSTRDAIVPPWSVPSRF